MPYEYSYSTLDGKALEALLGVESGTIQSVQKVGNTISFRTTRDFTSEEEKKVDTVLAEKFGVERIGKDKLK